MFDIVLFQPEIPPNTGNIMRLCANTGVRLHLVEPLGFVLTDKTLARAGMDYIDLAKVTRHRDWSRCREVLAGRRFLALTKHGEVRYDAVRYQRDDVLVFGSESRGLPADIHAELGAAQRLRLPMLAASRSLNLSNATAIVVYEAWRQLGFAGGL